MSVNKRSGDIFDIDSQRITLEEEEQKTQDPNFWNDAKAAQIQLKVVASIKSWINAYDEVDEVVGDLELMPDFVREGVVDRVEMEEQYNRAIELIESLELKNMLREEEDKLGAIVMINSGAGGTESQDWSEMLLRMYLRWGEKNGYKLRTLDILEGDEAGIKSAVIEVEGEFAYGYLKSESGVHRLVRISPFNAQGKRQTSFASVFVAPAVDDTIEVELDPSLIVWETYRSGGAGGQNVNKVETGVRVRYQYSDRDTGESEEIIVENTETRSQLDNRQNALRILKSRLYKKELEKRQAIQAELEGSKRSIEWGSQIRSYTLHPYKMVKDHRTNHEATDAEAVLDGELNDFIKDYLMEFGHASA